MIRFYIITFFVLLFFKLFVLDTGLYRLIQQKIEKRKQRKAALFKAKNFLKPYKKIFGDFCLSNKNCSVSYLSGNMIFAMDKNPNEFGKKRNFVASDFDVVLSDDFWNSLCKDFSYHTNYDEILSKSRCCTFSLKESFVNSNKSAAEGEVSNQGEISEKLQSEINTINNDLLDVNSCSEAELMALPGITVIIAKKIIKYREEKGTFKSVDEFLRVMEIKPHFADQIKKIISANPVETKKKKKIKTERIIDI